MFKLIASLFIFLISTMNIYAVSLNSKPLVNHFERQPTVNYTQREYGDSCSAQNWAITEDLHGIMYFGNAYRVLQYDGENWDPIRIPLHGVYVTSLMAAPSGEIFVGASGEFGFLKTKPTGKYEYVSLSDSLSAEDSFFNNVWRIYYYNQKVLFFAQENIFLWDGESLEIIEPQTSFHLAFVVEGELFVRQRGIGLMKYDGQNFKLVKNGEIFSDYGIFGIFPGNDNEYLLVSQEIGLFKYSLKEESKGIYPLFSNYTDYLNNSQIIGGTMLHNNLIALSTLNSGVVIIDQDGNLYQIIDQNSGLRDNEINQVFQDSNNNLWITLNTGISMVNYNSGISMFDYNTGIWGTTQSVIQHNEDIFAGTSIGLFKKNIIPDDKVFKHFSQIGNTNFDVKSLMSIDDNLIIGSSDGLFVWSEKAGLKIIEDIDAPVIYFSQKNDLLFVIGENGLFVYATKRGLRKLAEYPELSSLNPLNIAENILYSGDGNDLWIGTLNEGAWNVLIKPDYTYEMDMYIGQQTGLGQTWVRPFNYKENVYFGVASGLMHFIRDDYDDSAQEDSNAKREQGFFDYVDIPGIDSVSVLLLKYMHNKAWISLDNEIHYGLSLKDLDNKPFTIVDAGRIYDLTAVDSANVWIATDDGLLKVNTDWKEKFSDIPKINFSRILTKNDSILFYYPYRKGIPRRIVLPYSSNRIIFEFASPFIENNHKALYSFKLEGLDEDWSEWTELNTQEYINLREGEYIFFVKAKDIYENESEVISYVVRILPPWYRTTFAYIAYGILALLIIMLIVKLSLMRLKAKNIQLEKIIEKRTEEIRAQKNEISKQHKLVLRQKDEITSSIRYASRIQNALVPEEDFLKKYLPESFIFWVPRDIVSGDFYWVKANEPYVSIVAADCTGHGVPGAFMSMLGIAFLNEVALREQTENVSAVLDQLREKTKTTLGQTGSRAEQKDGMDLAFCTLNTESNVLYYAGANNPLFLIRNNELTEYKPTRNPIGIHHKERPFETHQIQLQSNDVVYIFSDGYRDQFGGPKGVSMGKNAFKELLLSIYKNPMEKQKGLLEQKLKDWMTDEYFQIDDILVIGFRV
ncbi:MAG: SpoIIE family protein phosphatase [Bacteroidota bacterium]